MNVIAQPATQKPNRSNATYLFRRGGERLPACSESFWTTCFSLLILHLAKVNEPLRVWECRDSIQKPWYWKRESSPLLDVSGLTFNDISVEPSSAADPADFGDVARFRPDVLLSFPSKPGRVVLIENKTSACAQSNQLDNYPRASAHLTQRGIINETLWLVSVGSTDQLYGQLKTLEKSLRSNFGVLLWEDVLQVMLSTNFQLPGVPVKKWSEYKSDFEKDTRWK